MELLDQSGFYENGLPEFIKSTVNRDSSRAKRIFYQSLSNLEMSNFELLLCYYHSPPISYLKILSFSLPAVLRHIAETVYLSVLDIFPYIELKSPVRRKKRNTGTFRDH